MKIGLYFGSFNPIHVGHLIIANHVANTKKVDQVWFVVSPQNPLKPANSLLNEYHRLNLVHIAIEEDNRFRACDIEFKLPKPSYTIDTLSHLKERYLQHEFSIIMGTDSLMNLHKWKNYELLLKHYNFFVYKRLGFDVAEDNVDSINYLDAPIIEISSTLVRKNIKENKSNRYLLSDGVRKEIEENNYYK
jgi:nicotinate-nucleotide adenylyltransferase